VGLGASLSIADTPLYMYIYSSINPKMDVSHELKTRSPVAEGSYSEQFTRVRKQARLKRRGEFHFIDPINGINKDLIRSSLRREFHFIAPIKNIVLGDLGDDFIAIGSVNDFSPYMGSVNLTSIYIFPHLYVW